LLIIERREDPNAVTGDRKTAKPERDQAGCDPVAPEDGTTVKPGDLNPA